MTPNSTVGKGNTNNKTNNNNSETVKKKGTGYGDACGHSLLCAHFDKKGVNHNTPYRAASVINETWISMIVLTKRVPIRDAQQKCNDVHIL